MSDLQELVRVLTKRELDILLLEKNPVFMYVNVSDAEKLIKRLAAAEAENERLTQQVADGRMEADRLLKAVFERNSKLAAAEAERLTDALVVEQLQRELAAAEARYADEREAAIDMGKQRDEERESSDECRRLLRELAQTWRMSNLRGNHRSCACSTCTKLDQLADEAAKAAGGGE